ncbi:MAG: non-canonical purine NTP pyrophosphatase, partial [Acidobacteria bacterium]|nr:non-canonical purine NTP pyrophosphatase [Acidobacteriota bacterium]
MSASNSGIVKTVVFATGNKNKIIELHNILHGIVHVKPLSETGIKADFEETGSTFLENSIQKAVYYSE